MSLVSKEQENIMRVAIFIVSFMIGYLVSGPIMSYHETKTFRAEAIAHGAAQYNPTTGKFEWKK